MTGLQITISGFWWRHIHHFQWHKCRKLLICYSLGCTLCISGIKCFLAIFGGSVYICVVYRSYYSLGIYWAKVREQFVLHFWGVRLYINNEWLRSKVIQVQKSIIFCLCHFRKVKYIRNNYTKISERIYKIYFSLSILILFWNGKVIQVHQFI